MLLLLWQGVNLYRLSYILDRLRIVYVINWAKKAVRQLLKLPVSDQRRILGEVAKLEAFPAMHNIKALSQHQYGFRLRIGAYRVLFDVATAVRIIDVQEVKRRDDNTY